MKILLLKKVGIQSTSHVQPLQNQIRLDNEYLLIYLIKLSFVYTYLAKVNKVDNINTA